MDDIYKEAKKRIKRRSNFFKELTSFAITSGILIFVNLLSSPGYLWFLWAVVPWGIVLVGKAIGLYLEEKRADWEEAELRKELRRRNHPAADTLDLKPLSDEEYDDLDIDERKEVIYKRSDLV